MPRWLRIAFVATVSSGTFGFGCASTFADILVFSRTREFRHESISAGVEAIRTLGRAHGFDVQATEDPSVFSDAGLRQFDAVVFLNTTGDVLDLDEQAAFERYIHAGGGFVGVHAAADTEYSWSFFLRLVGATFLSHDAVQPGTLRVEDRGHPASANLPDSWIVTDEWYNFRASPSGKVHVLASLVETSVTGGRMGADHPIAWYREFEGGRSFYTARGHTAESFAEPAFRDHLLGGISWAMGAAEARPATPLPDASGLRTVVLDGAVSRGMELDVASDGRVFFVERRGLIKLWDPETRQTSIVGSISVHSNDEDGLIGLVLDPGFADNGWLYLFYSAVSVPEQRVARFSLVDGAIEAASERVLLRIPVQRGCCHAAGSLEFAPDGNLFISVGDNTNPFDSNGFAPIDERPGRELSDAQRSAANTDDLRGKILRIRPQSDGTYAVPPGNLFPADGSAGRPEIFVMGCRNPFRFGIHPVTGWLYWGDVGPDAQAAESTRGPAGHDELNLAPTAGNFGWPYFVADNQAYRAHDFATGATGDTFVVSAPVNLSINNTGARVLPPAQGALIFYPYVFTPAFPELGSGMRALLAGPVYQPPAGATRALPRRFEGAVIVYELMRDRFFDVRFDTGGALASITRLPDLGVHVPIDVSVGPDGALYILEYGPDDFFFPGVGRLVRVEGVP
jgi:glucose/arabinose dehydrogenase